jgi:hypothetical protein
MFGRSIFAVVVSCLISIGSLANSLQDSSLSEKNLPLVTLNLNPAAPTVGQNLYGFLRVSTDLVSPDEVNILLEATLDTVEVELRHPTKSLWVLEAGDELAAGEYTLSVKVVVEDKAESDALRKGITVLNNEISDLEDEIALEEDPGERALLESIRDERILEKDHLAEVLLSLRQVLATENFTIEVVTPQIR